jgi:hypothetical protein
MDILKSLLTLRRRWRHSGHATGRNVCGLMQCASMCIDTERKPSETWGLGLHFLRGFFFQVGLVNRFLSAFATPCLFLVSIHVSLLWSGRISPFAGLSPNLKWSYSQISLFCWLILTLIDRRAAPLTNRVKSEKEKILSETTIIIYTESYPHQSPFPSLDLSSRCSNLSWALSPEHANESAGSCSGGSVSGPLANRL